MRKAYISIISAVYNSADFIGQCIESICCQTYKKLEIIIVDDGSDDGTGEICDSYAEKDNRIKVIHQKREGVLVARRKGFELSSGDYVSIIDGDDYLEENMIEKLYKEIVAYEADISMCGRIEESENSSRNVYQGFDGGFYDKNELERTIYPKMISNGSFFSWGIFPSFWDKLFKRSVLAETIYEFSDMFPIGNDAVVVYPSLLKANSIVILNDCLYHYRQYSSSMVHTDLIGEKIRRGYSRLYSSLNTYFEKSKYYERLKEQWIEYMLFLMIPRAPYLFTGLDKKEELFPFKGVKKGSKVIVYGMGLFGKKYYEFLKETEFCTIVGAVDREYKTLQKEGYDVESPETIKYKEYDAVLITLSYAKSQNSVIDYLESICPKEKIHKIDIEVAKQPKNLKALGLI